MAKFLILLDLQLFKRPLFFTCPPTPPTPPPQFCSHINDVYVFLFIYPSPCHQIFHSLLWHFPTHKVTFELYIPKAHGLNANGSSNGSSKIWRPATFILCKESILQIDTICKYDYYNMQNWAFLVDTICKYDWYNMQNWAFFVQKNVWRLSDDLCSRSRSYSFFYYYCCKTVFSCFFFLH